MIATSPKARSRSTTHTLFCPLLVRASPRFTARVVLRDAALGGEHRDELSARDRGRAVIHRPMQRVPHLTGAGHCLSEPGEVTLLDDLAHSRAQRLRQDRRVNAATNQDDAGCGAGDPQGVREGRRRLQVDAGAENDGVVVRRLGEEPLELSPGSRRPCCARLSRR